MQGSAITWELVNNIWPIVVTVVAVVVWLNRKFAAAATARSQSEERLKSHVDVEVKTVTGTVQDIATHTAQVERELLKHQRFAAENFATKPELARSHDEVKASIDKLSDKIDDVIRSRSGG
ncbi:hypothetical protein [Pelagibacterium lentulum]|uniref:DUF2746 domain-containing protein n=1 Tax=Pelagibacterium lentulum TaxID=2029865 RepID=A0A916RNU0_9HYPH|nr:hypothetical protein [Pelagibacterium lentulum]GGA60701.1 hypothetical protein GCM10011499_33710 [Pelagibacterium lentulum]